MKPLRADTLFARILEGLAVAVCRRPRWFFYPQAVLFLVSVLYTVGYLQFNTDRSSLVGAEKKYHQLFRNFKKEFPIQDDLVVVVESDLPEKNRQFVERLGAKLESRTNLFRTVFYRGDLRMLGSKALQFVPEPDLVELRKTLQDYRPFLIQFTRATNLVSLFDLINKQFLSAKREQSAENDSLIQALPALERILAQATDSLRRPGLPPSPGLTALFNAGPKAEREAYITFDRGRVYLVTANTYRQEQNAEAVSVMRRLMEETQQEVPGLNAGLTGEPVLELDEMDQSQRDSTLASVVSLTLCALVFIYAYRETGRPVKATICLLVGVAYTMAFTTLVVGHLNILTITFVPILIGLAIDFGVHLVTRYEEELRQGKSEEAALTKAMVFTGQGIVTGALTTAGAFLAMALTDFKGIQEMGIICGTGLIICLVPMLTLLPVLLLRGRQNVMDHQLGDRAARRARIEQLWLRRPMWVNLAALVVCVVAFFQLGRVYFDYNLLNMQSHGLASVEFEKKLIDAASATNTTPKSLLFGVVIADSLDQAEALEMQLTNLPVVAGIESLTRFLREDQSNKLALIREIKQVLHPLTFAEPDPRAADVLQLSQTLYSFHGFLGMALEEVEREKPELARQFVALRGTVEGLRRTMFLGNERDRVRCAHKLGAFQRALFDDLRDTFAVMKEQDSSGPLRPEDLPRALRDRFIGVTGKYLIQVYPKKDVWQRENQKEFIREIQRIYPNLTGTPVQLCEYTELLKLSYQEAAWYALGAIALLVWLHFRSVGPVVLALLPVLIGSIWLGGFMGFCDIPFNPANIMTLPLVIGIGVTNGIHILNRFAEEQNPSILARSTGKAVLVSGLMTIAGFGSLMLAQHRGIATLGYVMSVGVTTCMIAGLTVLPAILALSLKLGLYKKQPSADNARSTLGREEPR